VSKERWVPAEITRLDALRQREVQSIGAAVSRRNDTPTDSQTTVDWAARAARHAEMDGDEWDAEEESFRTDWTTAYAAAFVEIAVSRGWKRDDAETWPEHLIGDA
jgi:hypothetical protein